jgi:hypothetical protein
MRGISDGAINYSEHHVSQVEAGATNYGNGVKLLEK